MSIKVKCVTYHDDFKKEKWPTEMEVRPMKGDLVRSESGKELIVRGITHTADIDIDRTINGDETRPVLEVRLVR